MRSDKLQDAIGEIRDDYLMDALQNPVAHKTRRIGWGVLAACLGLVIAAAVLIPRLNAPVPAAGMGKPVPGGSQLPAVSETAAEPHTQPAVTEPDAETMTPQEIEPTLSPDDVIAVDDTGVGFGLLYPTKILPGYRMIEGSYQVYGEDPAVWECRFEGDEPDDQLLIRISGNEYFGVVRYGVVIYGDEKADGSRSSSMYFERDGFTVLYQFTKADIAQLPGFFAMVESAPRFAQ